MLGWLATALAVAVLVTSVGGWGLLTYYDGKIQRIPGLGGLLTGSSDGPVNLLVVGVDSRAGLTPEQQQEMSVGSKGADIGQRSDTMMLVHVSGDRDDVTVVSLPRDSLVTIPAYTDADGDEHGCPAQQAQRGVRLWRRAAADRDRSAADRAGHQPLRRGRVRRCGEHGRRGRRGGRLCPESPSTTGPADWSLDAGPTHVDGAMGLAFVRARHIDPTADIGRMERQQQFIAAMFQRATSLGVLLNPAKLSAFLDAALSSVTVDQSTLP